MRTHRPEVLVLMGGPDAEREVSLLSGRAVATALRQSDRYRVTEAIINRPSALEIEAMGGDIVFPVLHGSWGEGGSLQVLLETIGKPYVGSGPGASALAMDKLRTKSLVEGDGFATPAALELHPDSVCTLRPPLVVKPVDDGSSVDIRICHTEVDVARAREELHPRRPRLMAEQFVQGRELTVGVVAGRLLPIVEIVATVEFYDYEAKYTRDDTGYMVNPDLTPKNIEACRSATSAAWELTGCRDIARADFRLDPEGTVWFLEINTMPGFTDHSLVPLAARASGIEMPALCAGLVDAALERTPLPTAELAR